MSKSQIYLNPDADEIKFLTAFEVGSDRIKLYGFPPLMSLKSNLIKSMIKEITNETVILAANIKIRDTSTLQSIWLTLNDCTEDRLDDEKTSLSDVWQLLNYFDVINDLVGKYLNNLIECDIDQFVKAENKQMLEDILAKSKIAYPKLHHDIVALITEHNRDKSNDIQLIIGTYEHVYTINKSKPLDAELKSLGIISSPDTLAIKKGSSHCFMIGNSEVSRYADVNSGYKFVDKTIMFKDKWYCYPQLVEDKYFCYRVVR